MDVRWIQRLSQYELALSQLKSAVEISRVKNLSDLEKQGLIKSFEYCHELAWNLMNNQDTAKEILQKIVNSYFQLFIDFQNVMNKIKNEQN